MNCFDSLLGCFLIMAINNSFIELIVFLVPIARRVLFTESFERGIMIVLFLNLIGVVLGGFIGGFFLYSMRKH